MRVEHIALLVEAPVEVASWYERNLGMKIVRSSECPTFARFLVDSGSALAIEVYRSDRVPVPDYSTLDPSVLHIAFCADQIEEDRARLMRAGATCEGDLIITTRGDSLAMLRDPWGLAIQLVHRRA